MRVLFVTPYVPSRIRVRPFHFIQSLAPSHEISLVSLVCDRYEEGLAGQVAQYCASVALVRLPKWQAYANCLRALPSALPLRVAYYQSPAFIERMLWVMRKRKIEVVHGELIKVMPALRAVLARERVPVLYDAVDCISSYLEQQWRSASNPLHKAFVYTELRKMRRYEQRSLRVMDQVVITSPYDRECLLKLGEDGEHIRVVPNGVDTAYFAPSSVSRELDSLVFCAKMEYYPHALAMGTPVVATPGSCRSLQVQHERHLLIAEGAQAYADAILRLLADPSLARQLAAEGRQYVEQHYSWDAATTTLGELYQRIHQTLQTQHMAEEGMPIENATTMMI